jgi:hypothetical protein
MSSSAHVVIGWRHSHTAPNVNSQVKVNVKIMLQPTTTHHRTTQYYLRAWKRENRCFNFWEFMFLRRGSWILPSSEMSRHVILDVCRYLGQRKTCFYTVGTNFADKRRSLGQYSSLCGLNPRSLLWTNSEWEQVDTGALKEEEKEI